MSISSDLRFTFSHIADIQFEHFKIELDKNIHRFSYSYRDYENL